MTRKTPPTRTLRQHPDLDQLKRQARELLEAFTASEPNAVAEVHAYYRGADPASFALHEAQLVLARAYGFDSWPKLKSFVDGVTVTRLGEAVRAGDVAQVRAMLKARPELVNLDMAENDEHRALHYAVLQRSPPSAAMPRSSRSSTRKKRGAGRRVRRPRRSLRRPPRACRARNPRRGGPSPQAMSIGCGRVTPRAGCGTQPMATG